MRHTFLHSRCDALTAMVLVLASRAGADVDAVRQQMKTLEATTLQKRLEAVEASNPYGASLLDDRDSLEHVDTELLKHLRFRS